MESMLFADVLGEEVVDDETEGDVARLVTEEAGRVPALVVVVLLEALDEGAIGNETSLLETVHATVDFDVNESVVFDEVPEIVVVHDSSRNEVGVDSHIFRLIEASAQVEVGEIDAAGPGTRGRDGTVDENLESRQIGGASTCLAGIIELVAANGEADTMLERLVRAVV